MTLDLRDRAALLLAVLAALLLGGATWLLVEPGDVAAGPGAGASLGTDPLAAIPSAAPDAVPSGNEPGLVIVVDVEGAVARPGIVTLPADARVADAIRAAGGYASDADLDAAARSLNLAARLADGAQVYVPVLGVAGGESAAPVAAAGGVVNLNTATADELDALPGIGPATVAKILAARAAQPFATLDELVDRKVLNRGQLDDIRDLVTV